MSKLQVKRIKISNIMGIDNLEFEVGKVTKVSGRNGEGKSSTLNAIRSALKIDKGQAGTLQRAGKDKSEVVLILNDGTLIQRNIKNGTSKVKREGFQ